MYPQRKSALRNLGLPPAPAPVSSQRKSLVRRNNGGRNLGLLNAPVQIQTLSGNQQQPVSPYTGLSNDSGQVGATTVHYANSGEVSIVPSSGVRRRSLPQSLGVQSHSIEGFVAPREKAVPLGGGKKRRTVRRGRKRKSPRRK